MIAVEYQGDKKPDLITPPQTDRILDIIEQQLKLLKVLTTPAWLVPAGSGINIEILTWGDEK